jgi:hypothetical protein
MLYYYKKIDHDLDKFHLFIKHLVLNVWCKPNGPFSTTMLMSEFALLVNSLPPNNLLNPIANIYSALRRKPKSFRIMIRDGFTSNNDIEKLCEGSIDPLHYSKIKSLDKTIANKLYQFFKGLYSLLDNPHVKGALLGISSHYKKFFSDNIPVCPFCGLSRLLNSENTKRDAYDHYFPKEIYPFNSVNFKNLVPMCHTCNSKYKTRKDPINLRNGGPRKHIFYPFSTGAKTSVSVSMTFNSTDLQNLKKADINLQITCDNSADKVDRWKEIFGIEERYKAACCDESAYLGWLEQYRQMSYIGSGISFNDYVQAKLTSKYINSAFLEVAYLQGCRGTGLI